jgi:predicted RNA methylase
MNTDIPFMSIGKSARNGSATNNSNSRQSLKYNRPKPKESDNDEIKEVFLCSPEDAGKFFPLYNNDEEKSVRRFRFTNVSIYSITSKYMSMWFANLLNSFFNPDILKGMYLTDASACIGGNTWSFAEVVDKVFAVEVIPLHIEILEHNMKAMGLSNIEYINDNYLAVAEKLEQEILFFDPPWGGKEYHKLDKIILSYNYNNVEYTLDSLVRPDGIVGKSASVHLVVMKLPVNYDVSSFEGHGFAHFQHFTINDTSRIARPIFLVAIFSKTDPIRPIEKQRFDRTQYKLIKTTSDSDEVLVPAKKAYKPYAYRGGRDGNERANTKQGGLVPYLFNSYYAKK